MQRSLLSLAVLVVACGEPPAQTVVASNPPPTLAPDAPVTTLAPPADAGAPDAAPIAPPEPPECSGMDVDLMAAAKAPACATSIKALHTDAECATDLELTATPAPGPYKAGKPIAVTIELRNKSSSPLPLVFSTTEFGDRDPGAPAAVWINDTKGLSADAPSDEPNGCMVPTSPAPIAGVAPQFRVVVFAGGKAKAVVSVATMKNRWGVKKVGAEKVCILVPSGAMAPGKYVLEPNVALSLARGQWPAHDARPTIPISLR